MKVTNVPTNKMEMRIFPKFRLANKSLEKQGWTLEQGIVEVFARPARLLVRVVAEIAGMEERTDFRVGPDDPLKGLKIPFFQWLYGQPFGAGPIILRCRTHRNEKCRNWQ